MERLDRSRPIEHAGQVPCSIEEMAPREVIDPANIGVGEERWGEKIRRIKPVQSINLSKGKESQEQQKPKDCKRNERLEVRISTESEKHVFRS